MKKMKALMFTLAGCLVIVSCSTDSNGNSSLLNKSLIGAYRLTTATLPTAQDLDKDGDSSTNAVLEGPCYNDSWISFHDDGTYDQSFHSSTTAAGGLTLDCNTVTTSGTYTHSGSTVTTMASGSGATAVYSFSADNRTVTATQSGVTYPSWNSVTALWTNLTGNLKSTYTKYIDDDLDNGATADNNGINDDENNANFWLLGNFTLNSYTVPTAQNLNNDVASSTNLVTESTCYGQSGIIFHQDGTYVELTTKPIISDNMLTLSCSTDNTHGTWVHSGDTITTTRVGSGTGNVTTTYHFNTTTHLLTRTEDSGSFPSFSSTTLMYTMLTGVVNYSYSRV